MDIKQRLQDQLEFYNSNYNNQILGIFLYGSQNYHLADDESDVDSRILCFKTPGDKVIDLIYPNTNEHLEIVSLPFFSFQVRNMNISILETLFTNFNIVDELYCEDWKELKNIRQECARINELLWVKNLLLNKEISKQRFLNQFSFDDTIIQKLGYTPKGVYHVVRNSQMLDKYIAKKPYEEVLVADDKDFLTKIKRGYYTQEECKQILEEYDIRIEEKIKNFQHNLPDYKTNYRVNLLINNLIKKGQKYE